MRTPFPDQALASWRSAFWSRRSWPCWRPHRLGRASGAHLNPAVSLAFWVGGRLSHRDLAGYVAAQLVGGLAGAAAGRALLPRASWDSIDGTVTHPGVPAAAAFALEAGMTALLLVVILSFSSSERLARLTPLAIVPVLTAIIWLGSPWTGASINPARSEGPALAFGDLSDLWLYLVAPSMAGLAVGLAWRVTRCAPARTTPRHLVQEEASYGKRTGDRRTADEGPSGHRGQERARHRGQLRHRAGDRGALRRVRRERRDQLSAPARGGRRDRGAGRGLRPQRAARGRKGRARAGRRVQRGRRRAHGRRGGRGTRRDRHPRQQRRHPDLAPDRGALERRLRPRARREPARLLPVRTRGDPPLPRRGQERVDREHLERPPADPEARLPRLLGEQGRDAEPHAHARARIRRRAASA